MNSLNNIERAQIPYDIISNYIKLYKSIGNNHYNHKTLESDNAVMVRQTIAKDVQYFAHIFGVEMSEGRIKSLIYKGVLPKNKEERLIINLHNAFTKVHNETSTFELLPTEIFDLLHFLFSDVVSEKKLQFNKVQKTAKKVTLLSSNYTSKRDTLEELIARFNEMRKENKFEVSFLIVSFYIDFLKSDIFTDKNKEIALVLLYILLVTNEFEVYEYISFFEAISINIEEFDKVLLSSMYNWEEGFNNVISIHRFVLKISLIAYDHINSFIRDYEFDKNLNKSDNIENTINKLDDIFSKDEIRSVHPYISDSTINRTLKRLRDEDKIRPLGKGRSAKWIKLYTTPTKKISYEQLDLKI
mgnify:FL=1